MGRAPIKTTPDQSKLLRLFSYDPETGALEWRANPKFRGNPGGKTGTIGARGYLIIGISGKYYLAHRIIWKIMTGEDPAEFVDHANGDRLDNRWANLRAASNGQNIQNAKLRKDNASGAKGVCWEPSHKAWKAYITANKKQIKLGRFKSLDDAIAARRAAETSQHGVFARPI